ncbi:hypothetical protein CDD81_6782 [Ophiocordyceps australis]|uniref:Uncharacterized protein n=1 Tax=Ophiocordyceps australis TaxID=1399860 RepID=A0A2C5Y4Z6_9HYPO|nr:hypothetical protein CDD81_6782 [Ophiocordyceps australis]
MPAAGDAPKSPKPARRLRSTESLSQADVSAATPPRQVRFESVKEAAGANAQGAPAAFETQDCQPTNFPQLGGGNCNQWFTAADPTRSVNQQRGPAAYYYNQQQQQQQHPYYSTRCYPTPAAGGSNITYIGQPQYQYQQYPPAMANMADYSNAAPPPSGVTFQPPVPDTTFGPIPHVYMPRFDAPGQAIAQPIPAGQPGIFVASQPMQPAQTIMINGQPYMPVAASGGANGPPGGPPPVFASGAAPMNGPVPIGATTPGFPDISGIGRTPNEEMLRQVQFAHQNKLFEPQEFKPGDDDPSRFYYVRELDGNWTQRNRYSIDRMACRWRIAIRDMGQLVLLFHFSASSKAVRAFVFLTPLD